MYLREIGAVVTGLMVACLEAPLAIAGLVASGRLGATQGLMASAGAALMLCLSTRSFMIIWQESPWTRSSSQPMLVGGTVLGSAGYSLLALLTGLLLGGM